MNVISLYANHVYCISSRIARYSRQNACHKSFPDHLHMCNHTLSSTAHTSGTPNPGCPADTPASSSASARCSGSGRRATFDLSASLTHPRFRYRALTLQIPQATVHSSLVAEAWLAWQSMHRSMMWLRQMAQLSTTMSQAQSATAFHCAID